jgi:glycine betaine/proline transport system ATP-binding protein
MQQRVGLARALATDPDVLLMDEPFSALDASMRRKLQDELRALQGRLHTTIVFVTHDLDEAVRLGDQLGVLVDGRLVQVGTPSEVVRAPATIEVADLVQHARL